MVNLLADYYYKGLNGFKIKINCKNLIQMLMNYRYSEKVIRERFARAVTRGLTELKIKKPTQSPIKGLIDNAVVEVSVCTEIL